ncbi:hypothetical protein GGQ71_000432 [Rhizobium taibaishanense]|uniref:Uncharacterized protein n=1 Tax=Allorhizobium taibaishanense TaxID=887144 RepID=A0A7W6HJT7_9HYPH|nr:hypothetical protein [Allorhizobium taibaishanense]
MPVARSARYPTWGSAPILNSNATSRMQVLLITRTINGRVFNINNY